MLYVCLFMNRRNLPNIIMKALKVPNVRWPGGCFADEYHWRKGVGPKRTVTLNPNWGGVTESNAFGTHEFMDFLEQIGFFPILCHGGGPRITEEMERRGLKANFIKGRRVTDEATLEIAHKVLIDEISANVVELIENHGGKALPLNGRTRLRMKVFSRRNR